MDDGNTTDVVHLDYAKAFDSAYHKFLLAKLESFGLYEKFVRWIRPYLTGRTYRGQLAAVLAQETRIKSGVPEGSVIGSLLFLLLINDLPSVISMLTLPFADDVRMVSPCPKSGLLQSSFYNVWKWLVNWTYLSPLPNASTSLSGRIILSNYPLPLELLAIPYRSQTLLKT